MDLLDRAKAEQEGKQQTEQEDKIVAHVKSKVEEIRGSANRISSESIWMTNIAYLLGIDGVSFNTATRQYQPVNRASTYLKKNRIHVNKILPTIQNRLARLCKNPPKYDVRPESNNTEDKEAARLSLQVLTCMWENLTLDKKRLFLYMWVQQCGHAWMKVSWDPTKGKPMVDPATGKLSYEGDLRCDVTSPFEIFPDPLAKTDEDVYDSWLIQCKVRKLDYFKKNYPEKGMLVKEEQAWLLSTQYEQRINALNNRGFSSSGAMLAMKDCAIEMIKYEARSEEYPQGRMIICANGILLEDKPLPCGKIPFAKFDDVIIGGKFNSEAIITHLRPIQDQFNETIRKRAEWTSKMLAGKYIAARGSGLGQESMNDSSGELVYYTPVPNAPNGGMPMPMQLPVIPQYAYMEEDKLTAMLNDISGISEVSRGTLPSASIPAIGMQLLTEQDDTRIGVQTEQHEHAWARIGGLILEYVQAYYQMPRKLKMAGKNLQYTVKEVSGADLKGNTDVIVIRGSTLPGSKTLRRQEILNTYQQGLLGDPMDPKVKEKVLGMIEFGQSGDMWEDYGLDQSQIKRGIEGIEQGIPVQLSEFDNCEMWILEINRYRKGDKWNAIGPEIQSLFMNTIEMALQIVMQKSGLVPPPVSPQEVQQGIANDPQAQAQLAQAEQLPSPEQIPPAGAAPQPAMPMAQGQ